MPGTLAVVATPIGNLEDITLRALRVLREASVIAAEDTRRTGKLLAHYGITTPTVSLHDHNEHHRVPVLIARLRAGDTVAVVTDAGTPVISDPGYLIVRAALDAGLPVEVIPGPSALIAAVAGAGVPADTVSFVGFVPARRAERRRWLASLASLPGSVVFFEAPSRVRATLEDTLEILGDRLVAVAHELTKVHESWHRGSVSEVVRGESLPVRGEFTIVLGPAAGQPDTSEAPSSEQVAAEFYQLTENSGLARRDAIAEIAARHSMPRRLVYSTVEKHKK